ncbi:MAG: IS66 family insertion sequence element accessory protein TnpB [Candidatus Fimisoma sp.]
MLNHFINDAEHIYLALGATDFRKQIHSLVTLVQLSFGKNPFEEAAVFLFCNKRKDSIKVLRFDRNGFVLAQKKLLEEMKFRWPKEEGDLKQISSKQVAWLLQGLEITQKYAHTELKKEGKNYCF